jgi:hypothetical protein
MRLDSLSPKVADEQTAETWQEVLDVLNAGEVPPEERERLQRRIDKDEESIRVSAAYQEQPFTDTGFILGITRTPFGAQSYNKARGVVPSRPQRRERNTETEMPLPKLGQPIGRYVARIRLGLTCKPKNGRQLFVKVFRSDTVNQQIAYSYRSAIQGRRELESTLFRT